MHSLVPHWGALVDMTRDMIRSMNELQRNPASEGNILDEEGCRSLYSEVTAGMETLIEDREADRHFPPELVVRNRLKGLPRQVTVMFLMVTPSALLLMFFLFYPDRGSPEGDAAPWIAGLVILFFLAFPVLLYRRRRTELLESIQYQRHGKAGPRILVDCAPTSRVFTGLAGAGARHLFWDLHGNAGYPSWVREGWIRLAQWRLVQEFCRNRGDAAGQSQALEEITEELKYAVVLVSSLIRVRPPAELRRAHSRYSTTSIGSFVTGKPLAPMNDVLDRSLGTACFFLAHRSRPEHDLLNNPEKIVAIFSC